MTSSSAASQSQPSAPQDTGALQADIAQSLRNALILGASLIATWVVAIVVRILLPRYLGPASFGAFQFADSFTTTVFILMTLGLETYIRKEVSTKPDYATQFFAGTVVLRLALSAVIMLVSIVALRAAGKPPTVLWLVFLLGIAQILFNINLTFAALLQSTGQVAGLSILNVGSKIVWGAGVVGAILFGAGLKTIGVAILLTEAARTVGMAILATRHLHLKVNVNLRSAAVAIAASMQFYVGHVAQTVYSRIDVSIMSFMASDVEVGWYGAASNLAGLSLLLAPLIAWVLLPLSARAVARSQNELTIVMRRAMEFVLGLAIPIALMLGLGADVLVHAAFGEAFAPAVSSLRILAPTFILTYVTMVSASMLIRLERGWALTWITISAMFIAPALNLWLIPRGLAAWGPGGAGDAAAIALLVTEIYAVAVMTWLLGRRAFDRRTLTMLAKTAGICCVVIVVDRLLVSLGAWRLVVDVILYVGLVVGSGAVDPASVVSVARDVLKRGKKSS